MGAIFSLSGVHAPTNLRLRARERSSQPSDHALGLSTRRLPRDGEHPPPDGCELGQPRFRLVPGAPVTVKRVSVALQRNLAVGPGEVEAEASATDDDPVLTNREWHTRS